MALLTQQIGPFFFLDIKGAPEFTGPQLELIVRPGVDGTAVFYTGYRGIPFTVRTTVDTANLAAALNGYDAYRGLKGANPVVMIWQGLPIVGQLFQVLDVRHAPGSPRAFLNSTLGLNPPSRGWLSCEWDLLPILNPGE